MTADEKFLADRPAPRFHSALRSGTPRAIRKPRATRLRNAGREWKDSKPSIRGIRKLLKWHESPVQAGAVWPMNQAASIVLVLALVGGVDAAVGRANRERGGGVR